MKNFKIVFGLFLLTMTIGFVNSQTLNVYNGNFNSVNFQGIASYHYIEQTDKRIFNGPFIFKTSNNSIDISGSYLNDLKNGSWEFVLNNVANTDIMMNYIINADVTGSFKEGNIDGNWNLTRTKYISFSNSGMSEYYQSNLNALSYLFNGSTIDFKKTTIVTEKSSANFKDNHFTGSLSYSINGGKSIVSGQFNEQGYFDGTWIVNYYQDGILHFQTRNYLNGVLLTIKNKDNSTGEIITVYDNTVKVNEFFQNYNTEENYSKVGINYLMLKEGKTGKSEITFLEDAIAIWYNNSSLAKSSYIYEIERGSNIMTVYPERIIVANEEKMKEEQQKEYEKEKLEEAKKQQLKEEEEKRQQEIWNFKHTDYGKLQEDIKKEFNIWLTKSDFETSTDYENRIKKQADEKFKTIVDDKINKACKIVIGAKYATIGQYDPDNETFPIFFGGNDTAFVKITKNVASDFYNKFHQPKRGEDRPPIYVIPLYVAMVNNQWKLSKAVILFDNFWMSQKGLIAIDGFKFINDNGKYHYTTGKEPTTYYEKNNPDIYGVKKYKLVDIKTIQSPTDFAKEVYFYELQVSLNNTQSLNFTYKDLNITLPE